MPGTNHSFTQCFIPVYVSKENLSDKDLIGDIVLINISNAYANFMKLEFIAKRVNDTLARGPLLIATTIDNVLKVMDPEIDYVKYHSHILGFQVSINPEDLYSEGNNFLIRKHAIIHPKRIINCELVYGSKSDLGYRLKEFPETNLLENYENVDILLAKLTTFLKDKPLCHNKEKQNPINEVRDLIAPPTFDLKNLKEFVESQLPLDSRPGLFKRCYRKYKNYNTEAKDLFKMILKADNLYELVQLIEKKHGPIVIGPSEKEKLRWKI